MPRYSEALQDVMNHLSAPTPRADHADFCNAEHPPGKTPCKRIVKAPASAPVAVEVIIHTNGAPGPVQRFNNIPYAAVMEAVQHLNDNAEGVGV